MNPKEVKKYYKVTEEIIKEDYEDEIIGIPLLNPTSPRSLKNGIFKKDLTFFIGYFILFKTD